MAKVNICLTFDGNCEEAFKLYRTVFDSQFTYLGRYGDLPPVEGAPALSDEDKDKIENVVLPVSSETFIMGWDMLSSMGQNLVKGNNFSVYINAQSEEEADRIFTGLSEGGQMELPMEKAFWGGYFGILTDRFGVRWLIKYDAPKQ